MGGYFFKPAPKIVDASVLKHAIANRVNGVSVYQTNDRVNPEDLQRFERVMAIVRETSLSEDWKKLVYGCSNLTLDSFEQTMCKIINDFCIDLFNTSHLYVLYAFVTDVTAYKLKKGDIINVNHVLNVIQSLIVNAMHKNRVMNYASM